MILDPGYNLTLRPMKYPVFYEMYLTGIKNNWTVEELDFTQDVVDLRTKMSISERHLINRLVAFFATGDAIVANNLVINLYQHVNSPEARMFYGRQLFEEMLHQQAYLTLLDMYIPDVEERNEAFAAIHNINSIKKKADFCFKWIDSISNLDRLRSSTDKSQFLLNLICFAACIEGLFFFAAFAYVYFLRSKGLLPGLASATNMIFRDETNHMVAAFEVIKIVKSENPEFFNEGLKNSVYEMLAEAIECEYSFAEDVLSLGVSGLSKSDMHDYLKYVADLRLTQLGFDKKYYTKNPFSFMDMQDVQEVANFFERRVTAYQVGVTGTLSFDEDF